MDWRNLNYDYIGYSLSETSTTKTSNRQMNFNIPGEDSVISLLNSYLDLNFEVMKKKLIFPDMETVMI